MPTKNESLNRRRQAIIDVREGISDTLSSLARGRQQAIENRRAEESHQLDLERARQVIALTDRQARMAEQEQADLSQAQGAIMQSRTMGPGDVAGDVGAAAGGGIAGGAMASPEDRIRQRRIELFKSTSEQVKDPRAREILNQEYLAFEQEGFVREQAQKFGKKIASDLAMGGLRPLGGGEEGQGKEGEEESPLEKAANETLAALELVRDPEQLLGTMRAYEEVKTKLMEQEERKAFKGLMLQRVEQEIAATPDAPTQRAMLGIYSRIQYGDLEEGEDIEKAIRYARAGLTPDEQRVLAWQARAMQQGAPPAQGGVNPPGAPQPQTKPTWAAPNGGAAAMPAKPGGRGSKVPTQPGKAVAYLTQLMDTAGKSTDIRDAVGELAKTFGEEQARALLAEAIRQKSEVRRAEMGG